MRTHSILKETSHTISSTVVQEQWIINGDRALNDMFQIAGKTFFSISFKQIYKRDFKEWLPFITGKLRTSSDVADEETSFQVHSKSIQKMRSSAV